MVETILFTRHGETEDNVMMRLSTAPPGPNLTELGRSQALSLRSKLNHHKLTAIYTSPLIRAKETSEIIRGNNTFPIYEDEGLRELSVGNREGRTDPGVFEEMDEVWHLWTELNDLNVKAGEGGETGHQVIERGSAVIHKIKEQNSTGTVLIVAHSGILQLLVPNICCNLSIQYGVKNWLRNCQLIEVKVHDDRLECISWSDKTFKFNDQ